MNNQPGWIGVMTPWPKLGTIRGKIIPGALLLELLFHPLTKYIFQTTPQMWVPAGVATFSYGMQQKKYALLVDTQALYTKAPASTVAVQVLSCNQQIDALFELVEGAQFFGQPARPYSLIGISDQGQTSEEAMWALLARLLEYAGVMNALERK